MSNLKESQELLARYCTARIPFIAINTAEKSRAIDILTEVAEEIELPFYAHTFSKGTFDLVSRKTINDDKSFYGAMDYINEQLPRRKNLTMVFTDTPDLSSDSGDVQQLMALCDLADENGGVLIALTNKAVHNDLQRKGFVIDLDLPDEEEMFEIINTYIEGYRTMLPIEWDTNDMKEAAIALAGITTIEAENVLASLVAKRSILKDDLKELRYSKDKLFSDISGLEKIKVDPNAKDVGGLAGLRKWLDEKRVLMTPEKKEELRSKGLQPPRGILLVGVPGCGKSLSAKSISANWQMPLYRLDFATVQGSYVGQSEQQLRDAFKTAENVSPCILWIDEIEKGLSGATGGGGDGGVSTRMVGQFLFWMQECKKQVFVVATANDVSMLPSELLRRGRFDELFFVDLPTAEERRDILALYMRKYLGVNFAGPFSDRIVDMTDGFTGADLESTVRDLSYRLIANPEFRLTQENMINAFGNVVPLSQTSPEKIEAIRDWGRERAVPASGRPIGEKIENKKEGKRIRKVLI